MATSDIISPCVPSHFGLLYLITASYLLWRLGVISLAAYCGFGRKPLKIQSTWSCNIPTGRVGAGLRRRRSKHRGFSSVSACSLSQNRWRIWFHPFCKKTKESCSYRPYQFDYTLKFGILSCSEGVIWLSDRLLATTWSFSYLSRGSVVMEQQTFCKPLPNPQWTKAERSSVPSLWAMTPNYNRIPWRVEGLSPLTPNCNRRTPEMFLKAIQGSISHATIEQKAYKLVGESKICCVFLIPVKAVIICQSLLLVGRTQSTLGLEAISDDASESFAEVFPS